MEAYQAPPEGDPRFTLEEMKRFVIAHFEDFVNRKKPEAARENFSADFLDHDEPSGPQVGPEAAIAMMQAAYQKWPDLHVTIEDIIAERDKVMVRNTWRDRWGNRTADRVSRLRALAVCESQDCRTMGHANGTTQRMTKAGKREPPWLCQALPSTIVPTSC